LVLLLVGGRAAFGGGGGSDIFEGGFGGAVFLESATLDDLKFLAGGAEFAG